MSREKQIEEMRNIMETDCDRPCSGCELENEEHCFTHNCAIRIYNEGYRKQSEVIEEFVKRFEKHLGNCTFSIGQTNDIKYALKKATEEMKEGDKE